MHKLLSRQLRKYAPFGVEQPPELADLLLAVSRAYEASDADRALLERSAELANNELSVANERLSKDSLLLAESNEHLQRSMGEFKKVELELRQSQKLEAVGRLASGIAHEINTPLQFSKDSLCFVQDSMGGIFSLLGQYAALARAEAAELPALRAAIVEREVAVDLEYLRENMSPAIERAQEGMRRVATIVGAMKDFAHPDRKEKSASDLNRAIVSTSEIVRNETKYVADLRLDLGKLPPVPCHLGELNQVFLNLIVNAAHAIGDSLTATRKRGVIGIKTWVADPDVYIAISDDGTGIPESVRDSIFLPFFTTKAVGRGTGQGLAISRSVVVEKHGGALTFETETGKGTTFTIRLPLVSNTPMLPGVY
jgi:two-component system, NtrC family, sensor kinase